MNDKAKAQDKNNEHIKAKNEARKSKEKDKNDAINDRTIVTACFDFQKVLTTPNAAASTFYYKRKLSVYNFTIHNISEKEGYCYVWDESISKKGPNEVCSCLYSFIQEQYAKSVRQFRFWSDNCPGQKRNKIVFGFYAWWSKLLNITITHRFLEKGHTQNEADSVHATIEKAKKGQTIYVPSQWYTQL